MKTISYFELLKMIGENTQPKKIAVCGKWFEWRVDRYYNEDVGACIGQLLRCDAEAFDGKIRIPEGIELKKDDKRFLEWVLSPYRQYVVNITKIKEECADADIDKNSHIVAECSMPFDYYRIYPIIKVYSGDIEVMEFNRKYTPEDLCLWDGRVEE